MTATAKKKEGHRILIHDPSVNGTAEFTDEKHQGMKTAEVALLVAAVRGDERMPQPRHEPAAQAGRGSMLHSFALRLDRPGEERALSSAG